VSARTASRRIVIIAEGDTERAARSHLQYFLNERLRSEARVGLDIVALDGGLGPRDVERIAQIKLASPGTLGVVAWTDLFPTYPDAATARRTIKEWMPDDSRCQVHVVKHDFEACLLVAWDVILKRLRIGPRKPPGANPEEVNNQHPPADHLKELYRLARPAREYSKPIDGKALFQQLDLAEAAGRCPEFKGFLNGLITIAGGDPIA